MTDTAIDTHARRRNVRPLLLAAVAVVALMAAFFVQRSVTGEFLATDGSYSRFPGELVKGAPVDDRPEVEVAYRHGEEYSFEFTLVNHSRWPTRILAISDARSGLLRRTGVAIKDMPSTDDAAFTPFHPFTIGGRGSKVIRVTSRFDGCANFGPNSAATLTAAAVR